MKFWKDNRIDGEYDMTVDQIAEGFLASGWAEIEWPSERKLAAYLGDRAGGGLSSTWEDRLTFNAVVDRIIELRTHATSAVPTRP